MPLSVVVREYAELTTAPVESSLSRAHIPQSCFDWLLEHQDKFKRSGKALIRMVGSKTLKLDSFVGFLQSPCGTSIEILPKHFQSTPGQDELEQSRETLLRMISVSLNLPKIEVGAAEINLLRYPLPEWLYTRFLMELDKLYKRGIRYSYKEIEEESKFLRGRLNTGAQLRQPPGRDHLFQIRHEIFTSDRPENRLIKLALELARKQVNESANWRLANELSHLLSPIPASRDTTSDFKAWGDNRLMVSYQAIRPWCELIIQKMNPTSQKGIREGISLLFEMEKLFENYVGHCLKDKLISPWVLKTQASSRYLCKHQPRGGTEKKMFQLKPDFILKDGKKKQVLDTKWKVINESDADNKYQLKEADFYQMYVYGQKYMNGSGDMFLIYPATEVFRDPLPVFELSAELRLWVVPFDIDRGELSLGGNEGEIFNDILAGLHVTLPAASSEQFASEAF
ncbi:McrC family protein [Endozoicomonas euniceicola]|uniref:McrC family protein n=1 Tax=Endozoicomonas euniceicola TaxID=1234143 RepID=A0ABY6GPG8_9GAMM|nr:McrC family protein [Endozoicomonas euniceicola]UYM14595.1 McrC family protein [Endozoicomonas euniceicola]